MSLQKALPGFSGSVNHALKAFFVQQEKTAKTNPALSQSLSQLREFSLRGGKTIRPFLVKLAFEMAGGKSSESLLKAASAIELHHKHILILDDIADRDEQRYGGPTLEWAYRDIFTGSQGEHRARSFAMLDSVWLSSLARELLFESGFESAKLLTCCHILNTTMYADTLAGWQIHALQCDQRISQVTIADFVKGLELVTARYTFEGPFKIGLTLAGNKNKKLENALTTYSQKVGTAFQIYDDILGLFGESEKTGKPVGNDLREGKKTLLVQTAYQRANEKDKKFLELVVGNPQITKAQIQKAKKIITNTGSLEESKLHASKLVSEGIAALEKLPDSESKKILIELARYIIAREK